MSYPEYLTKKKKTLQTFDIMTRSFEAGKGTYGIVYSAKNQNDKTQCVVKRNIVDKTNDFIGSLKELDILIKLKEHPYVIDLKSYTLKSPFESDDLPQLKKNMKGKDDHMFFIFDQADYDIYTLIYEKKKIESGLIKNIFMQMLLSLEYIHSKGIIHRDIKPSNFLWFNKEKRVKLCDFGLAKIYTRQGSNTPGVVTSVYKSPEICMNYAKYDFKADIWSLACIFYEFVTGSSFIRDRNEKIIDDIKILNYIIASIPEKITESDILRYMDMDDKIKLSTDTKKKFMSITKKRLDHFDSSPGTLKDFVEVLKSMVKFHPENRFGATEALNHTFFDFLREEIEEERSYLNKDIIPQNKREVCFDFSKERELVKGISLGVYRDREKFSWYNHRILFLSIDIFDRYLNHTLVNAKNVEYDEDEIWLKFTVCVYISIKYFTSMKIVPEFNGLLREKDKSRKVHNKCFQFEKYLLVEVLEDVIYRGTILEAADEFDDVLNEDEVLELLKYFLTLVDISGITYRELYKSFRMRMGRNSSPIRFVQEGKFIPTLKTLANKRITIIEEPLDIETKID